MKCYYEFTKKSRIEKNENIEYYQKSTALVLLQYLQAHKLVKIPVKLFVIIC